LSRRKPGAAGEPVTGRQGGHPRLGQQFVDLDAAPVEGAAQQRQVGASLAQRRTRLPPPGVAGSMRSPSR
jgi:hypothetical protein